MTNKKAKNNSKQSSMTRRTKDMTSTSMSCRNRATGILCHNTSTNTNQTPLMKIRSINQTSTATIISWPKSKRKDMWKSYGEHSKISCLAQHIWWTYLKRLVQRLRFSVRIWVFRERKSKLRKLIFSIWYLISKVHL